MLARWPTSWHSILNMFCMKPRFCWPSILCNYIWPVLWLSYFNILLCFSNVHKIWTQGKYFEMFSAWCSWQWLSWHSMTHEPPIAHCHPEGQTWIHSLLSCLAPLFLMIGLNLDNASYLCLEPLFPGGVHKNANFRNLRWEHHFVFKEWSMSRDHCLLSSCNGSWLFFEMCRRAS